ncbi:hypothetical protein [Streptobacillus moniliformis]|uniref:hypothetical protein n=1 Tax=Streptobacillus moniliformis TaxID=34105 RepID=UPI0007E48E43|nr:hypothetical protein [Streptobacillus moniliformis]
MLKKYSEIKWKSKGDKDLMFDDIIDKNFVMEHKQCKESTAFKLIKAINKNGEKKYKKNSSIFGRGRTSLKWYWEYLGLSGEFI